MIFPRITAVKCLVVSITPALHVTHSYTALTIDKMNIACAYVGATREGSSTIGCFTDIRSSTKTTGKSCLRINELEAGSRECWRSAVGPRLSAIGGFAQVRGAKHITHLRRWEIDGIPTAGRGGLADVPKLSPVRGLCNTAIESTSGCK